MSRVCIVHDWLINMRGGEKVLAAICELYPDAPIYTLFYDRNGLSPVLKRKDIHASFLQRIPGIKKFYRWWLPIFPSAIRSLNLKSYDLVISSSHCVAKGVNIRSDARHICYCHSPMRYIWGMEEDYFGKYPKWLRGLMEIIFKPLRKWDVKNSQRVDQFIANSNHIAKKIKAIYNQDALVIHPPVDALKNAETLKASRGDYYLVVSALVPYKRVDLALEAFKALQKKLIVVGDGPLRGTLEKKVGHENIEFKGWVSSEELTSYYQNATALIFPGEEDFGIVPVEAQMHGVPVIAYGSGGVLDSVMPYEAKSVGNPIAHCTGIFFKEQTAMALITAVRQFEKLTFEPATIRSQAEQFGKERFKHEFAVVINKNAILQR